MKRTLKEAGIAVVVPLIIAALILSDDRANKKHGNMAGLHEMTEALIREEQALHARDAHLEGVLIDHEASTLKRLVSRGRVSEAEELAKSLLVAYYREKREALERNRGEVDRYLAALQEAGQPEKVLLAELDRLLGAPLAEADKNVRRAEEISPKEALPLMLAYYERRYQEQMNRAAAIKRTLGR